jgi:hypothetical protein
METDKCLVKYILNKPPARQQLLNEMNCVLLQQETFFLIFNNTAILSSRLTNKRLSSQTLWISWWTKTMGLVFVPAVWPLSVIIIPPMPPTHILLILPTL